MTQEVLCTAYVVLQSVLMTLIRADCPIYYMRTQVHKDLKESGENLMKFDIEW